MSTTITATATEPANDLTAPTPGADTDTWGEILNEQTLVTLLAYILWLKENMPEGGATTLDDLTDVDTTGSSIGDVLADTGSGWAPLTLGTAAAADTGDFATAAQGALADTALQPGDELTALAATGITAGYVAKADGANGIVWAEEAGGGGGGGSGIEPSEGLVVVQHGAVAATARPTAGVVYWMGSVAPTNKALGDLWLETGEFD